MEYPLFNFSEFFQVISNARWFHALWYWRSSTGKLLFYKNGNQQYERSDILKKGSLPKIINGVAHIGDSNFHGDITGINLWSFELSLNTIVTIALNPGNAPGNIFSWKFVEDAGYAVSAPSKCHNRQGKHVRPLNIRDCSRFSDVRAVNGAVTISLNPHQAISKICLTTVGIEPTTQLKS